MAKVYIMDNSRHTGHAAMELEDGTYISFHPKTESALGPIVQSYPAGFSQRLADDIEPPDYCSPARYEVTDTVRIYGLDERAMADALEHMRTSERYQLFTMNCSTIVAKLLIVGTGETILGDHVSMTEWRLSEHAKQFFGRKSENLHGRLTERAIGVAESAVLSVVRTMAAESKGVRMPRRTVLPFFTAAVMAADVLVRDFVWTPGEVLHLAEYIKEHLPDNSIGGGFGGRRSRW